MARKSLLAILLWRGILSDRLSLRCHFAGHLAKAYRGEKITIILDNAAYQRCYWVTELVRHSVRQLRPLQRIMRGEAPKPLPGYRVRIIDGNHFGGTEHRLKETRTQQAAPLPGFALAILIRITE